MPLAEIQRLKDGRIVDVRLAGDPLRPWGEGDRDARVFDFEARAMTEEEFAAERAKALARGGDGFAAPLEPEVPNG